MASQVTTPSQLSLGKWLTDNAIILAGVLAIVVPTMISVAQRSWSTEQGGHGPIVLATGLWLLYREWQLARPYFDPPPLSHVLVGFVPFAILYFAARVAAIYELEGYFGYALLVVVLYSVAGGRALRMMWFPLVYMAFLFPPPDTVVAMVTNPLKVSLSSAVVNVLYHLGLPIASAGVTIQVGQYELLVADACSGLNSLISLSAISLFYVYLRHHANPRYALVLVLTVLPVAILANVVRILFLVLLTYYGGEAVAQGFLHQFAGLTMFLIALIAIFSFDYLLGKLLPGLARGTTPISSIFDRPKAEPAS